MDPAFNLGFLYPTSDVRTTNKVYKTKDVPTAGVIPKMNVLFLVYVLKHNYFLFYKKHNYMAIPREVHFNL